MGALPAFRDGIRRVNGAPAMLTGLCLVTLLVALPLSFALSGMIEAHLGESLAAERAAAGVNHDWWQEFSAQASGLGTTFTPGIIGFAAVLENVSRLLDNLPLASTVVGATAAWMIVWTFLSGGVLDRYARRRPTRARGFFGACGAHFGRLVRLGVIAWIVYAALFASIHPWLFDDLYPWLTRDTTAERSAFAVRAAGYAFFGLLLIACNVVFDYARIRIVVEDRHSAIGALAAAVRFVRREPGALALYLLNASVFLLVAAVYAVADPGAPGAGFAMWAALLGGQIYIVARHYVKLLFYASQTSFFQAALAHAAYTAAPPIEWPESPAAEAVLNADPTIG